MFTAATTMTDEMVDVLVGKLNEAFNVPLASEETEGLVEFSDQDEE